MQRRPAAGERAEPGGDDPAGVFFLQVEGASIDKQGSRSTTRKTTPTRWSSSLPTGYSTNLTTKDGQTLSLTYGTAGYQAGTAPAAVPPSQQHTGAVVPVWASGPGGLAVLGTNDHTDLFDVLGQ